jgi:hypothetical protein
MRRALAALALLLAGCATAANTPQQNLGYERWDRCAVPRAQLDRVGTDGRIVFQYTSTSDRQEVLDCLAAASRQGPALPEPQATRPPGGP